jgi:hypothetical protein
VVAIRPLSSDIELERLEFTTNHATFGASGNSSSRCLFTYQDIDAFLAKAADTLGACIAVFEYRKSPAHGAIDLDRMIGCMLVGRLLNGLRMLLRRRV